MFLRRKGVSIRNINLRHTIRLVALPQVEPVDGFCVYNMKEIKLSRGMVTIVDNQDFKYLHKSKWCISVRGYAIRGVGTRRNRTFLFILSLKYSASDMPARAILNLTIALSPICP